MSTKKYSTRRPTLIKQRDAKAKYLTRLAKSRLAPKLTEIDVDIKTYNELCNKLNTSTFKSKFVHDVFRTKAGKLVMTSKSRLDVHVNNQVVTFRKKETIFIGNSNVYEFESKNLATTLIVKEMEWNEFSTEEEVLSSIRNACSSLVPGRVVEEPIGKYYYIVMPKAAGDLVVFKEVIKKSITSKKKYTKLVFEIIESVRKSLICLWEKENKFYADLKLENVLFTCEKNQRIGIIIGDVGSLGDDWLLTTYPAPEYTRPSYTPKKSFSKSLAWFLGQMFLKFCKDDFSPDLKKSHLPPSVLKTATSGDPYFWTHTAAPRTKREITLHRKTIFSPVFIDKLENHFQTSYGKIGLSSYFYPNPNKRPSVYKKIVDDGIYKFP